MKHLDLFSGIGGFSLAAQAMGWETVQFVEINSYCQKVLKKNFPKIPIHENIKTFDSTTLRGTIDIITGGFPCQPFSHAGRRKGMEDDRYLWPEMLRVIREVQPPFVVGENVYGFVNWSKGLVFEQVLSDLENEGYEIASVILPACAVNAPHRRDRIWIIAYSRDFLQQRGLDNRKNSKQTKGGKRKSKQERETSYRERIRPESITSNKTYTNSYRNVRSKGWVHQEESKETERHISTLYTLPGRNWENFPTKPGICRRNDGIPNRVDRIKALGNAIVPQVAIQIFQSLEDVLRMR